MVDSGDIEVKNRKSKSLQIGNHFQEKPGAFLRQYFEVGMVIDHRHFYVRRSGQLTVVILVVVVIVAIINGVPALRSVAELVSSGLCGVLRESEELGQWRRRRRRRGG